MSDAPHWTGATRHNSVTGLDEPVPGSFVENSAATVIEKRKALTWNDPSENLAREGKILVFRSIISGVQVSFKAWINSFSDSYTSNWNSDEVYGRMDPMMVFKNTQRKVSIEWDVVAGSGQEAASNMVKISKLIHMLYPEYQKTTGQCGRRIAGAPLIEVSFLNWATGAGSTAGSGGTTSVTQKRLLGACAGFDYKPDMDAGQFEMVGENGVAALYPQFVPCSAEFTILHRHPLGWENVAEQALGASLGATPATPSFPYGEDLVGVGLAPSGPPPPLRGIDQNLLGEESIEAAKAHRARQLLGWGESEK